jgi:hypothetical protein
MWRLNVRRARGSVFLDEVVLFIGPLRI